MKTFAKHLNGTQVPMPEIHREFEVQAVNRFVTVQPHREYYL